MRYSIYNDAEKGKMAKIQGMYYWNDEYRNGKEMVSLVLYSHDELLLKDLIKMNESEMLDFLAEGKQWIDHLTEEEAREQMRGFYNGEEPGILLKMSDITMDTPCGDYRETDNEIYY